MSRRSTPGTSRSDRSLHHPVAIHVGSSTLRREDERLLRGEASFIGNINVANQLWMRVVRSTIAHGRVLSVDVKHAERMAGVALVLTGADGLAGDSIPIRAMGYHALFPDLDEYGHPVLAVDRVHYVGQPVAAVFADDPYRAEDAAGRVVVEYDELPALLDPIEASQSGILLHKLGNVPAKFVKEYGDVDRVFEEAPHVFQAEIGIGRQSGVPMEMRGCLVQPLRGRDELEVWGVVHAHNSRKVLAAALQMPLSSIHMRPTDFGGNFGVRGGVFPEYVAAAIGARQLKRPVKWHEDRLEHMVAISHAREQIHRIEGAFDSDGRLLGLRDEIWHNQGAFLRQSEPLVSDITAGIVSGPYRVPAYRAVVHVVTTNKTPLSAYRAPGRFEVTLARERLLDQAARELAIDPVDIRLMNVLSEADLPWEPGLEMAFEPYRFDSGDVRDHLEKALKVANYDAWRKEASNLRSQGRLVGNGVGVLMDKAGLGQFETAKVSIDPRGRVRVLTGASSVGQGIETVLAQIVADELGIEPHSIDVLHGDTDELHQGVGSWSSRSTVFAGGAAKAAAQKVVAAALEVGAKQLGVALDDAVFESGQIAPLDNPTRSMSLWEIAALCEFTEGGPFDEEIGLSAAAVYSNEHMNYPYGITFVQIELDPTTGGHEIRRLFTSAEGGRVINPMTTRGQIVGAAVQGIGGSLFEEFQYDSSGQPLSTSFMDYLLPDAQGVPEIDTFVTEDAPTRDNSLGAKGLGEVGIIAVGAAIAGAIDDALGGGTRVTRLPLHPQDIHALAANRFEVKLPGDSTSSCGTP